MPFLIHAEAAKGLLTMEAAIEAVAERRAVRSILSGKRLAYAGAIGGTAVATAATAALLIARSRKRGAPLSLAS